MQAGKASYIGIVTSLVTFTSLFLPWWSIRANGVSIDIYPYRVRTWNVPTHDTDWVVDRLLALNSAFLIVGLLVVVSGVLALIGSLKRPFLLIPPAALNLTAAFIFYRLMRSAIGSLAHGYLSGTNLIPNPEGPWGFVLGLDLCVLAGLASLTPLILSWLTSHNQLEAAARENNCESWFDSIHPNGNKEKP